MNPKNVYVQWAGFVVSVLIGALLVMSAVGKVSGNFPPEAIEGMKKYGLYDNIALIGWGEIVTGVLLVLPWTSPLGTLVTSGFWGGTILLHMTHNESYAFQAGFLVLTWVAAYLRGSVPLLRLNLKALAANP